MASGKISIKQIAERCNVSIATVSYVINGVNKVSEEKKAEILRAINELGYKRNMNAVALSKNESKLICILLPLVENEDRLEGIIRSNPFYMEFLSGAESISQDLGYDVILSGTRTEKDFQGWVEARSIDGIIAFDSIKEDNIYLIRKMGLPCCLVDARPVDEFVSISINDEEGEYQAVKYLIENGHTRIAFACSSLDKSMVNKRRYAGYVRALGEHHIDLDDSLVLQEGVSYEGGRRIASKIVEEGIDCSAVVATSDILALGIMKGLADLGKRVPEDYSIIGYDDIQIASYLTPSLSTVRQDTFGKGREAVSLLVKAIKGEMPEKVVLESTLVIRDSVARR